MLCSPSPAAYAVLAYAVLSGREAKHAAEAGITPSPPQFAAEGGPAASLAMFDPAEMLLFPPGLVQLHEQQAGLDILPFASKSTESAQPASLIFVLEEVRSNLYCHTESLVTCLLTELCWIKR